MTESFFLKKTQLFWNAIFHFFKLNSYVDINKFNCTNLINGVITNPVISDNKLWSDNASFIVPEQCTLNLSFPYCYQVPIKGLMITANHSIVKSKLFLKCLNYQVLNPNVFFFNIVTGIDKVSEKNAKNSKNVQIWPVPSIQHCPDFVLFIHPQVEKFVK